jgi:CubicO group peptidase (beta-lactamase class C family)
MNLNERVNATIDAALGSRIVGCVVLINQNGKPIFSRTAGYADREAGRKTADNEIFRLASCTKPIVATTALVMIDKGLLSLDDPVTKYLPFFTPKTADGATPTILIRHLLTHTSGITYADVPDDVSTGSDPGPAMGLEENLRRLSRMTLAFAPGAAWDYGMSIDMVGGVLATINGSPDDLDAVVQKYVTGPLGMIDTRFYATDPKRLAHPYADARPPLRMAEPQEVHNDPDDPGKIDVFSPGRILLRDRPQCAGSSMAGTAQDFMKLMDALAVGDLLRPATRDAAFANQIGSIDRPKDPGQKFSFIGGVIDDAGKSGWHKRGLIHWGGIWGNNWIIDPATKTTVVVMTNTMREGCNGPFRDEMKDAVFG